MPPTLPTVAPDQLTAVLDGRWGWVREIAEEHLADPLFAPTHGLDLEAHRERVRAQIQRMAEGRGPRLGYPRTLGGDADVGAAVTAFELLAHSDLSLLVKAGVQWGLFGGAILHLGTQRHHERHLPAVLSGDLLGCFAMTETGHGSDVQSVRTTATYDPATEEFVVHTPDDDAVKNYIGNAARDGRMAAVFAQLVTGGEARGVHCLLVPIRDADGHPCPGVELGDCGPKGGLNGVDNGTIRFTEVRVPRDALLDRFATVAADGTYSSPITSETGRFFTMLGTLVQGRTSVSGAAVSAAKLALTIAVRYGLDRRQFIDPGTGEEVVILDFLAHQRKLLPLLARTYVLNAAQRQLVERLHEAFTTTDDEEAARLRRDLEPLAAGLKAATTWHATHTIQTCREACGGAGYMAENRLVDLRADSDVFTTFEGDNTVLLQLVAKTLLTQYRDDFLAMDTLGTVRHVAELVFETLKEKTAAHPIVQTLVGAVPGGDDARDLLDREWQLDMLRWREEHVVEGVARRIKGGVDAGGDEFAVFNACQDHVLKAARAHVERVVLDAYAATVAACDDPDARAVLEAVGHLAALAEIEADRAWFLEHGRLSRGRSKAVTAAVNDLCAALRPHARTLVDAFAIPDAAVAAPIALGAEARRQAAKRAADPVT